MSVVILLAGLSRIIGVCAPAQPCHCSIRDLLSTNLCVLLRTSWYCLLPQAQFQRAVVGGCVHCFSITCQNLSATRSLALTLQDLLNKSYAFNLSVTLTAVLTSLVLSHPLLLLYIVKFLFRTIFNTVHSQTWIPDTSILLLALVWHISFFLWIAEINADILIRHIFFSMLQMYN